MEEKFIQFFQDRVLAKKGPLRDAGGQNNNKFLKNISKGDIKMGSAKGTEQKMVMDGLSL